MRSAAPEPAGAGSHLWRLTLLVLVVSAIFWLGALNIRAILGGELLKFGTLTFEDNLARDAEREIFRLISLTSILVMAAYVVVLFSSIIFLATSPFRLKEHGWLMISAILFYLFVPVECFTMWLDGKMIYAQFFATTDTTAFRELFLARLGALAGAPLIAQLCYYTIVVLAVFQPFRRKGGSPV